MDTFAKVRRPRAKKGKPGLDLEAYARYAAETDPAKKRRLLDGLMRANDALVQHVVGRLSRRRHSNDEAGSETPFSDFQDLMQAGRMGLMKALEKFRPDKVQNPRAAFTSYAAHWMRHFVQETQRKDHRTIYRPKGVDLPFAVLESHAKFLAKEGREPTAAELGIKQETYDAWRTQAHEVASLDEEIAPTETEYCEGEEDGRRHVSDPETLFAEAERLQAASDAIERLPDDQRKAVTGVWLHEKAPGTVAREMGVTVPEVQTLVSAAMETLRDFLE